MKKHTQKQNILYKIKNKIIRNYKHKHPLLFFAVLFDVFIIVVFFIISTINNDLDLLNTKRLLFNQPDLQLQADIEELTKGYPIEKIAPLIARENRETAAFMVAIARKESAWGKRTPKLNGQECYNYWGFRKKQKRMGSGGHTCFNSPNEAVYVVARRISRLIKKGYNTPEKMVLWKCGDCTGSAKIGAKKWIQDVNLYYKKIYHD